MATYELGDGKATRKRIRLWIVAPVTAIALFFAPVPAHLVDQYYSQSFYLFVQRWLTAITNRVPSALVDWMIAAAALLVLYRLVLLGALALAGQPGRAMVEGAKRLVRAAGVLLLWFVVAWGLNYRRLPIEAILANVDPPASGVAALRTAVMDANALAGRLHPKGAVVNELSYAELAMRLSGPMNEALASLGRPPLVRTGVPKTSLLLTPFFTAAGVNGMINPLALESIVHPHMTPAERGFVLAHEWAHLAGYADEAEASAVGWLACMHGGSELAYSASVYLILEAGGALPPEEWRRISPGLDAGVRADLTKISERMREQDPRVQQAAERVYDEYLKANRVEDGTASYGRALTLILRPPFSDVLAAALAKPAPKGPARTR